MTRSAHLPIPEFLVRKPRLVIWHGDIESTDEQELLNVLDRTYYGGAAHLHLTGSHAGGNDWSAWHLPDAEAIRGLHDVASAIAPPHWHLLLELT